VYVTNVSACSYSESSPPAAKKPRTSSVMVEQSGGPASNKVLIDQVTDMETNLDEVCIILL
jgi:hypothetical protein